MAPFVQATWRSSPKRRLSIASSTLPSLPPSADHRPWVVLRALTFRAVAASLARPADAALLRATLRQAQIHGIYLTDRPVGSQAIVAAHSERLAACTALAGVGLYAGLGVSTDDLDDDFSAFLDALHLRKVPALLIVGPGAGADAGLGRAREWLATRRSPLLRVAWHEFAVCAQAPRGEMRVRIIGTHARAPVAAASLCARCPERTRCPGPTAELAVRLPLTTVSNQIDLIEGGDARHGDDIGASVYADATQAARAVMLMGIGGETTRHFRLRSDSVAARSTLGEAAARGQLWFDVSTKARLDDFAEDLRGLVQVAPQRSVAGGFAPATWRATTHTPFAREEAALSARVAAMRGTIVDVGAGPLRYTQSLADPLATGRCRYIAVEPDATALARLRTALPGAILVRGVGEALPLPANSVDHVMVLRSWNHLRDPQRVLIEAARILRPGGRLLVVDNVAFALLRTADSAARAHAISVEETPFEHFRNDDAAAACAVVQASGAFIVEMFEDVGPGTGNQWLLDARRTG